MRPTEPSLLVILTDAMALAHLVCLKFYFFFSYLTWNASGLQPDCTTAQTVTVGQGVITCSDPNVSKTHFD